MRQQTEIQTAIAPRSTIRRLDRRRHCRPCVRLVQLDSADAPEGELLGAEIEGTARGRSLRSHGGRTVADPFSRTRGAPRAAGAAGRPAPPAPAAEPPVRRLLAGTSDRARRRLQLPPARASGS